ncbi:DUF268 domain-containing protein [Sphingobacteriales bacterium CHB3]|nr:DUF268 domain-containing protein [Sphingobacteriales bacterium CHB3]
MKRFVQRNILDPARKGQLLRTLRFLPAVYAQWKKYVSLSSERVRLSDWFVQLNDATKTTPFDPHYFYQSAWLARKIAQHPPRKHVDVASQIDMIAPLSAFVDIEFVDLRPLEATLPRLKCVKGSILNLPYAAMSVGSISSLHVVEHIGLGRYGDPLDVDGCKKACAEMQRVLAIGGNLYLSTPIGQERVEFNAHRVYSPLTIGRYFNALDLVSFSIVDDEGNYTDNATIAAYSNLSYGLGLFHFTRCG